MPATKAKQRPFRERIGTAWGYCRCSRCKRVQEVGSAVVQVMNYSQPVFPILCLECAGLSKA